MLTPSIPPAATPASPAAANDNAWELPVVRVPPRRPEAAYARSQNLILPLRFARHLPEWSRERPKLRPLERVWRTRAARTARLFDRLFSK
jgi:hypothetical protein